VHPPHGAGGLLQEGGAHAAAPPVLPQLDGRQVEDGAPRVVSRKDFDPADGVLLIVDGHDPLAVLFRSHTDEAHVP